MRILIIEDDASLTELLTYGLEAENFTVDICHDGQEGLILALMDIHDIILLDRMLPGMPGEKILRLMRESNIATPVIFITALGEPLEKIAGLDLGADDYLVKPFDIGELSARIRSVARRTFDRGVSPLLEFGDIRFSEQESKLIHRDSTFLLSQTEGELLAYLLRNPNQLLTRQQIIGNVWGPDTEIEDGNLDNYIYFLRKKLGKLHTNVRIKTVYRKGYRLECI